MRHCINKYDLIENGDRIAVGVSGGKDSMILLKALKTYQRFSEFDFELEAFTVDLGFDGFNTDKIAGFCQDLGVKLHIEKTDIKEIVFDIREEKNPCSLCAHMRRGAIHKGAKRESCNKLALGHHADDLIDTFFLSTFYQGEFFIMPVKSYLDRRDLTVIRPLLFVPENLIINTGEKLGVPISKNPCTVDGHTKRQEVNDILQTIYKDIPESRTKIFTALMKEYDKNY